MVLIIQLKTLVNKIKSCNHCFGHIYSNVKVGPACINRKLMILKQCDYKDIRKDLKCEIARSKINARPVSQTFKRIRKKTCIPLRIL